MSVETVKQYFKQFGIEDKVRELKDSSATVELAAQALGVQGARIAKTLSFKVGGACVLIVAAGDAKIDNARYKAYFGTKAKMLAAQEVQELTGHPVGGVCPFAVGEEVRVYLDESLKRFDTVFPAYGSANSAIELTCDELKRYANAIEWIDVCKNWQTEGE
ncbi:MAG: YbaK/EbsC family protein [Christensenella sp.]|uniref:YbaK/EbsC family protein n=1 Tax=Christensenella sp. TaxID=1935934 RepID=UPI002B20C067|nr:YbaK/EbsC family protein [Christensenella sp.]MEA5003580.1 YbaK/EbsC family protein [Christensenella sp.]